MGSNVKWAQMKDSPYSGPQVFGKCDYVLPANPTGFDVIVAAIAKPEGGAYDTVVMYDGTAVTYGVLQWTFTSGRLHELLLATARALGEANYCALFGCDLFNLTELAVGSKSGCVQTDLNDGTLYYQHKKVTDFFKLRDVCTPPGGSVPRTGKNWERAKAIALLFSKFGENAVAQKVQIDFFRGELKQAIKFKRPQMANRTIASFLYPDGWEGDEVEAAPAGSEELSKARCMMAARALFWGMWQNSPVKAQTYLGQLVGHDLTTQKGLEAMAKKFAFTPFARWGVVKARNAVDKNGKPKPYVSRYQKVATAINSAMGQKIVPELWK